MGASGTTSEASSVAWRRMVAGASAVLSWMVCSSFLIIFNTNLYRMGFRYPMMVTGMGQVFSAVGGWALARLGVMPLRHVPPGASFWPKLVPIILCTAGTMFTGNVAYLYLSVAFIQILKAFTPAVTMLLCLALGVERLSLSLVISIALIALGTSAAVLIESGTPAFSLFGFLCFMLSSATEAGRVVAAEILLGAERFNTAEALVYIGGPAAGALILGAAIWEGPQIAQGGWLLVAEHPMDFFNAFFISFLVNLTCFFAIQNTSSLTFKVAGCVKNVAVVWYGVLLQGEVVSGYQMLGYLVSVVGFALYSHLKVASNRKMQSGKQKAQ